MGVNAKRFGLKLSNLLKMQFVLLQSTIFDDENEQNDEDVDDDVDDDRMEGVE